MSSKFSRDGVGAPSVDQAELETRTTGSQRQSCNRCGRPIKGRRRNGFCSARCRMAVRRESAAARKREVLGRLKSAVRAVEDEFGLEMC
jgi:hypothetical protein